MALTPKWSYMLRIPGRRPHQMRVDRLAEYMREFAMLLGTDNEPTFAGIRDASVGLQARVPPKRRDNAWKRIQTAKMSPDSKPAKHLRHIESLLGQDALGSAELQDSTGKVLYLFQAQAQVNVHSITIRQRGEVDGTVTGLIGADDSMHLHIRDVLSRDLRLIVRDEGLARELLAHFRRGQLRLRIHGTWARTEDGWVPEANRCVVDGYEVLDDMPASTVFSTIAAVPGNGWCELASPSAAWRDLRGIN